MKIALIKYNAGNIQSVTAALNRLGIEPVLTNDKEEILAADKVIFPGVGEASTAMRYLKENGLDVLIPSLKQPVLGICLGLQLMCKTTEEGNVPCLDIFPVEVKKFPPKDKVPHMGWNSIKDLKTPLFHNLSENSYVYFVHSFYAELSKYTIATSEYILPFSAALHKDNFYAVQFHPEKSGKEGEVIIKNFVDL